MSTHALGNVQLITVQEVEAMLNEVVIPEASIDTKVAAEAAAREAADTALTEKITAVKQIEEASNSNLHFSRLKDLPIATVYIDTGSITFNPTTPTTPNQVIATVPERYLPKYPVDFITWATVLSNPSEGNSTTGGGLVMFNLSTNGDIKVVFAFPIGESYPARAGKATVTYITKE